MCTVTEQDPEKVLGQRPGDGRDPVNHHPPEEWRPGDAGDPIDEGPQPPGEPSHGHGGPAPQVPPPAGEQNPLGESSTEEQHPTGAPPEPVDPGQLSEGPSGPEQAGYEHAGYAPGYGESDLPGAGAGSRPGGSVVAGSEEHRQAQWGSGRPPPGGYGPQQADPTPWGKVLGIGVGALLILLLLGAGCMSVAMFTL